MGIEKAVEEYKKTKDKRLFDYIVSYYKPSFKEKVRKNYNKNYDDEIDEIFEKIKKENQARLDTLDKSHNEIIDRASNKAMESIINESKQTRQMANDCIIEGLNETLKLINAEMESGIKNLKDEFNRSKKLSEIIIRLGIFIAGIILATCSIKVITSLSGAG